MRATMSRSAYKQLLMLAQLAVATECPDPQVSRFCKGLTKALPRWLQLTRPEFAQARSEGPRARSLAPHADASLSVSQGDINGTPPWPERKHQHFGEYDAGRQPE